MVEHDLVTWLHPTDCIPPHGLDMTSPHDYLKVEMLYEAFVTSGFDKKKPALVGYPLDGKVQLLSGTHRHRAALMADIELPVTIWLQSDIIDKWGTDEWKRVMADVPLYRLERLRREVLVAPTI